MTDLNTLQHDLNTATSKLHELERMAYGGSSSGGGGGAATTTLDRDTKHLMSYDLMNMITGSKRKMRNVLSFMEQDGIII